MTVHFVLNDLDVDEQRRHRDVVEAAILPPLPLLFEFYCRMQHKIMFFAHCKAFFFQICLNCRDCLKLRVFLTYSFNFAVLYRDTYEYIDLI